MLCNADDAMIQILGIVTSGMLHLWGEIFDVMILTFRCLCIFSGNDFSYAYSSFLRLKRSLEQAQASMAKRLKVGAASKDSG